MNDINILVQLLLSFVYLFILIMCAVTCGAFFSAFRNQIGISRITACCWGVGLTPFFIGFYMLLIAIIPISFNKVWVILLFIALNLCLWKKFIGEIKTIFDGINRKLKIGLKSALNVFPNSDKNADLLFLSLIVLGGESIILEQIHYIICNSYLWAFGILLINLIIFFLYLSMRKNIKIVTKVKYYIMICSLFPFVYLYIASHTSDSKKDRRLLLGLLLLSMLFFMLVCIWKKTFAYKDLAFIGVFVTYFCLRMLSSQDSTVYLIANVLIISYLLFIFTKRNLKSNLIKVSDTIVFITLFYFIILLLRKCYTPVIGSDATEYLSNALRFAKTMEVSSLNSFKGVADGTLFPILHNPAWVLYLAFALLFSPPNCLGYPFDFAARFAFIFVIIGLAVTIYGLTNKISNGKLASIACIMPFAYENSYYVFGSHSVDAFRIIPIMIFITLLICLYEKREKITYHFCYIGGGVCACIIAGHIINAIQSLVIVVAFVVWCIFTKRNILRYVSFFVSCLLGALAGAYRAIWAYFETGSLTGNYYSLQKILENTMYGSNYLAYSEKRIRGMLTWVSRLVYLIIFRDKCIVFIPAICVAILVIYKLFKTGKTYSFLLFLASIILIQPILFTDLLKWDGFSMSRWFVMNTRYTIQMYMLSGIFIGVILDEVIKALSCRRKWYLNLLCIGYLLIPMLMLLVKWSNTNNMLKNMRFVDTYFEQNVIIDHQMEKGYLMIDNYWCNYYLNNRAISFFTEPCRSIRYADTVEKLDQELENMNISAVMISNSFIPIYWENTPLLEYVADEKYVECVEETDEFKIYCRLSRLCGADYE